MEFLLVQWLHTNILLLTKPASGTSLYGIYLLMVECIVTPVEWYVQTCSVSNAISVLIFRLLQVTPAYQTLSTVALSLTFSPSTTRWWTRVRARCSLRCTTTSTTPTSTSRRKRDSTTLSPSSTSSAHQSQTGWMATPHSMSMWWVVGDEQGWGIDGVASKIALCI